ncbi:MAG: HAD-IA family hydrolase [Actinobacteria bacterium]|nr:HAD-IA family hydrolase [Actinomycetota bacterium]
MPVPVAWSCSSPASCATGSPWRLPGYRPFHEVATGALRFALPEPSDEAVARALGAFEALPAHPDAEPALVRLVAAGLRVIVLTNGGEVQTRALLQRTGLDPHIEAVVGAEGAGRWKPAPGAYRHAARVVGIDPSRLALVAVHSWDVHGARRAGLMTGWASRLEGRLPEVFDPPHVSGRDLVEVADALMALDR